MWVLQGRRHERPAVGSPGHEGQGRSGGSRLRPERRGQLLLGGHREHLRRAHEPAEPGCGAPVRRHLRERLPGTGPQRQALDQRPGQPRLGRLQVHQRLGPADRLHVAQQPLGDARLLLQRPRRVPRLGLQRRLLRARLQQPGREGPLRGPEAQPLRRQAQRASRQLPGRAAECLRVPGVVPLALAPAEGVARGEAEGVHGGLAGRRDALPLRPREPLVQDPAQGAGARPPRDRPPARPGALGSAPAGRPAVLRHRRRRRHHLRERAPLAAAQLVRRGPVRLLRPDAHEGGDPH
mmetsp:Transcript_71185/g.208950  ORF Transcript_71185/g.208950 Transcript_71185/m.208950 type:complete len:294 (+) Transcript_71185:398-1279(+)